MQTTEIVQQGIDYIEAHLHESLSLDLIAESASMSVPSLYRMFYSMTGHPIKEYIRKRRISEAAIALRQTSLPISKSASHAVLIRIRLPSKRSKESPA